MDLRLIRTRTCPDGVFGKLCASSWTPICYTLEHSFDGKPALPDGVYQCVRGLHELARQNQPFMTFEITNVPGHTGILFHCGDWNEDSHGCVLLGQSSDDKRIYCSRAAFSRFMALQGDASSFTLTVSTELVQ